MDTTTSLPPRTVGDDSATSLPVSIRLLRRLNPLIAGLLRSPLHRLLSRDLLLLGYRGVKSGRRHQLPLSYAALGEHVYLCTRSSLWWRNLRGGQPVQLRLRGRSVRATPRILDPASREALDAFRAFLTSNPRTGEMLYQVRRGDDRRPREDDLARQVLRSVVVRLEVAGAP